MEYLSERVKSLAVSQTLAMAQKSRELKARGLDIISLSLGEPDFNTPDYIKEAAKKAIDDNYSKYPPVPGYSDLREAISAKFKNENGLDYSPEQIIVSAGGKHSLINVILSLVNPGDEVIILAPYWVSYYDQVLQVTLKDQRDLRVTIERDDSKLLSDVGAEIRRQMEERDRKFIELVKQENERTRQDIYNRISQRNSQR
jgi:bifunctional pyridoxal-dependent enzyme with beta-cystathionase and maltose regulon repressor activities